MNDEPLWDESPRVRKIGPKQGCERHPNAENGPANDDLLSMQPHGRASTQNEGVNRRGAAYDHYAFDERFSQNAAG